MTMDIRIPFISGGGEIINITRQWYLSKYIPLIEYLQTNVSNLTTKGHRVILQVYGEDEIVDFMEHNNKD